MLYMYNVVCYSAATINRLKSIKRLLKLSIIKLIERLIETAPLQHVFC